MGGSFSYIHWIVLGLVIFLLFGSRLPSVMRSLGQGVVEFKKGLNEIKDESSKSGESSEKSDKS
jgi:sec-independent protein translocase protein TatA